MMATIDETIAESGSPDGGQDGDSQLALIEAIAQDETGFRAYWHNELSEMGYLLPESQPNDALEELSGDEGGRAPGARPARSCYAGNPVYRGHGYTGHPYGRYSDSRKEMGAYGTLGTLGGAYDVAVQVFVYGAQMELCPHARYVMEQAQGIADRGSLMGNSYSAGYV
ncbi:MAG: hypothetical protein ABH879_02975 [archaeon]